MNFISIKLLLKNENKLNDDCGNVKYEFPLILAE